MHIIIDFSSSKLRRMTDKKALSKWMKETAKRIGMTAFGEPEIRGFPFPGSDDWDALSGCCFLKESAIVIHCYPEKQFVFLDIFSCKDFNAHEAVNWVKKSFKSSNETVLIIDRGVRLDGSIQCADILRRHRIKI